MRRLRSSAEARPSAGRHAIAACAGRLGLVGPGRAAASDEERDLRPVDATRCEREGLVAGPVQPLEVVDCDQDGSFPDDRSEDVRDRQADQAGLRRFGRGVDQPERRQQGPPTPIGQRIKEPPGIRAVEQPGQARKRDLALGDARPP